jgi:TatD DNase family protein
LPVIIHSRNSSKDIISILKKYKVKGIIHSFNNSLKDANEYISLGFLLGINGVVTFKNSNLKNILKSIDLKNIVLETDSPYLTPVPYRGKKNSPFNIIYIAKFLEKIYEKNLEEIKKQTTINVNDLFDNIFS